MVCLMQQMLPLIIVSLLLCSPALAAGPEEQDHFFESKIRPILAKRCFECHGEKKQESSIRLDHKTMVMGTTAETSLITPGNVEKSRLWQVIKYDDNDVQMPPAAQLPDDEKSLLKTWIEQGAFWPEEAGAPPAKSGIPYLPDGTIDFVEAVQQHWAYRPIANVPVPVPNHAERYQTEIDRFLAGPLEQAGLTFSPPASRETLIRRLKMDLHGVPPAFSEVQAFVQNESPHAVDQLVDELLASPLYGQRWGRHWLDVARYADTKGYVFTQNRYYPYSYTYRDYVVNALNNDTPYNDFIREQLAADQLGFAESDPRLAALGFLTVGARFLNREPDIIDDRIDVVTRGLMGMTVSCARCHDHKFDPIPTKDYYSLYGVFQSSYEPDQGPLIGKLDMENPGIRRFYAEREKREKEVQDYITKSHHDLLQQSVVQLDDLIPAAAKSMELVDKDTDLQPKHGTPRSKLIEHWKKLITRRVKENDPVFTAWKQLMAISDDVLAQPENAVVTQLLNDAAVPAPFKTALQSSPPHSRLEVARMYASVLQGILDEWNQVRQADPAPESLPDPQHESIRTVLYGPGSITDLAVEERSPLFERDQHDQIRNLKKKVDDWDASSPDAPPRAMVMLDKEKPVKPVVFVRGNPGRRGDSIDRHAPRLLDPEAEKPFTNGSGRKELAERIVAEDNPLTARVIVNRVWSQHFGVGLVSSASDFGSRADPPVNPELLDYLAWMFIHEDHWSLKSLHRRILLTQAYQQASHDRPEARQLDSENQLLWRQNRQRMDFESMRDSMLQVTGQLNEQLGGRAFNIEKNPDTPRRTIYALIDRNNLPGLLRTFDFPSPDTSSPGRPLTTVPQQALYALNSPFAMQVSQRLAEEIRQSASEPEDQSRLAVERIYSRSASSDEMELLTSYLQQHPLEQLTQALLMSSEFLYVD